MSSLPPKLVEDIQRSTDAFFEKTSWAGVLLEAVERPQYAIDPDRTKVTQDELLMMFMVLAQLGAFREQWKDTRIPVEGEDAEGHGRPMNDRELIYAVTTLTLANKQARGQAEQVAKRLIADARRKDRGQGALANAPIDADLPAVAGDGSTRRVTGRQVQIAFDASADNRTQLLQSMLCGCYVCGETFLPQEIRQWEPSDAPDRDATALCPHCENDSVVGSKCGLPIEEPAFLKSLGEYFASLGTKSK